MNNTESNETVGFTVENCTQETETSNRVESAKKLCNTDDEGRSQLKDDQSLKITDVEMEDLHDEVVRETLNKDHAEGARENSAVEGNSEFVAEAKETDSINEVVVLEIVR